MRTITTAILILLLAGHAAQAGVPQTVAIGVDTSNLSPKIAAEIQDSIATHVLHGLGEVLSNVARTRIEFIPIPDAKVEGQIRDCDGETCLQNIAQSATVDQVVRVKVQAKKAAKKGQSDYVVSLIVARAYPEREGWRDQSDCKNCGIAEIKHMASLVAGSIAEKIKIDAPLPPAPVPPPPLVAVAPAVPPPATILGPPSPAPREEQWSVPRYLSATVFAGGAALVVTGIYLLHIDGQGRCDVTPPQRQCSQIHGTNNLGTGFIVGGGIAAAAGVVGFMFFGPTTVSSHVAVGFTASSILVRGAF